MLVTVLTLKMRGYREDTMFVLRYVSTTEGIKFMTEAVKPTDIAALLADNAQTSDTQHIAIMAILERGRTYSTNNGRSLVLKVYTTSLLQADALRNCFGGNYYGNTGGFEWTVSATARLEKIVKALKDQPTQTNTGLNLLMRRFQPESDVNALIVS